MRSSDCFKEGRCVQCTKDGCSEICPFFRRLMCIKTLLRVGEQLYMEGNDALGVKYYSLAILAKDDIKRNMPKVESTVHYPLPAENMKKVAGPKKTKSTKPKFESVEDREKRRQLVHDNLVSHGLMNRWSGMFGVYAPKPVCRSAAMSFQRHRG